QLQAFRFAKVGLAAARQLTDWKKAWLDLLQTLPPGTIPVAAAYADAEQADSPAPEDVLDLALEHSLPVFLLDTWCKTQGNVFQVLSEPRLERLRAQAQGRIRFALAGSLTLDCLSQLLQLQPDIVALRGAVCLAGRKSPLSGDKVRHWKSVVSQLTDSKSLV
ncbi:MAG: (5-formylfuran-3-yl)methyl phosphate synthase, partial [Planctomycetota bacterium]